VSEQATTPFSKKCEILGQLWMDYRDDQEFTDFIEYNDLGLPLAYAISEDIVKSSPLSEQYISETFELFLNGLNLEDEGFETLEDILGRP
jgi:hypothetical protein